MRLLLYLGASPCSFFFLSRSLSLSLSFSLSLSLSDSLSLSPADNESVQAAFVQEPKLTTPDLTEEPGSHHRSPGDQVHGTPGIPRGFGKPLGPTCKKTVVQKLCAACLLAATMSSPNVLSICLALLEIR